MHEPPRVSEPRWSADRMWWWDGVRWIPAGQVPVAPQVPIPPPPPLPPSYMYLPPAYTYASPAAGPAASPGLRVFLIVMLAVATLLTGLMGLWGAVSVTGGYHDGIFLWLLFVALFVLSLVALIGVLRRSAWGRWVALAAGIAVCITCLGALIGIPIVVAAARAPLGKPAVATS